MTPQPSIVQPARLEPSDILTPEQLAERHYSPAELAETWNLSEDTVRRMFENESGVLIFENAERSSSRRRRTIRISEAVAERVYRRLCTRAASKK